MKSNSQIRNVGIFAHVDTGKTTLTERMLYHGGSIREMGSVDTGTAHSDRLEIERRRGISVRSSCVPLRWRDTTIYLLDTPGHVEFSAEVERSMWALDGALLLLNADDAVQPHAQLLFDSLRAASVPTLLFVNKTDRPQADLGKVIGEARSVLSDRIVNVDDDDQIMELMACEDDDVMRAYLEGEVYPTHVLHAWLQKRCREGGAYPLWAGSALRDQGIVELLDAIVAYLPPPSWAETEKCSGIVFGLNEDPSLGRGALVRQFTGTVQNRQLLDVVPRDQQQVSQAQTAREVKITQVRSVALDGRGKDIGVLGPGEMGIVYGLGDIQVGDVLGDPDALPKDIASGVLVSPLLMVKVEPLIPAEKTVLRKALYTLSAEDPLLQIETYGDAMHVRVMGAIQVEVLEEMLRSRFGVETVVGPQNIVYRETIREPAVGFFAYTMPKPCWAVIKFQLEPLPRGSGIQYESVVPAREIMPRYQHQIEQALPQALRQGMLGWRVDDIRITLIGGEHHLVHTHPLDFVLATPVALMDGLRRGGTMLLEPMLQINMNVPQAYYGRIVSEINMMRGEIRSAQLMGDVMRVTAIAPLATSVDFSIRLASITGGAGAMTMALTGFQDCEMDNPPRCPRNGVDPLDTAKYILAARSAMDGGVFEG